MHQLRPAIFQFRDILINITTRDLEEEEEKSEEKIKNNVVTSERGIKNDYDVF